MIKRCKFIVALALCLCVFAYDTVNISSDWGGRSIAWADDATPTFSGNALVLTGQLGLYFYMSNVGTGANAKFGTMNFTITNGTVTPSEIKYEKAEDATANGQVEARDSEIGFRCDVNAIQMADKITAEYTYNTNTTVENNGTDAIKSVKAYLDKLVTTSPYSTYTNLTALVNAIRDYGHYAQVTLGETNASYGDHMPMDASETYNGTDKEGNFPTEDKGLTDAYKIKIYTGDTTTEIDANTKLGITFTLDLDSKTALRVYLPKGSSLRSATNNITVAAGSANSIANDNVYTVADNVTTPDSDTEFQIVFSNISAHQLGDTFTIPVTINSTSYTIVISPMSYVYAVTQLTYTADMKTSMGLDDDNELTHFKQAVVALYNYYEKTLAYRKAPTATN